MMYSIGEMIHKVKISRRTLHYYDEIGLLKPTVSRKTATVITMIRPSSNSKRSCP